MEATTNYSHWKDPNIEQIINNLTKVNNNTKEHLKEIFERFYSLIFDLDISNIQAYQVDSNSLGLVFTVNNLDFRIEFFSTPTGDSEYIASMKSDKFVLFYKMGPRSDFEEIRKMLENEIKDSSLENGVNNKYYDSGLFINLSLKKTKSSN